MQLQIRSRGLIVNEAIQLHVDRRLKFALDRVLDRIGSVTVRLGQMSGTRGSNEKFCSVELRLVPSGRLIIHERASDLLVAIDRATDRLGTSVVRSIKKAQHVQAFSIRNWNPGSNAPGA